MHVLNVHRRTLAAPPADVGRLIEGLGSNGDLLWPTDSWPPMRFDRPLQVGADGGHGPIRYDVIEYAPGRRVVFRFKRPVGFDGTHAFDLLPRAGGGCEIVHAIDMNVRGAGWLAWVSLFAPLHDALLEDAFDRASALTGTPFLPATWSLRVRLLRAALGRPGR